MKNWYQGFGGNSEEDIFGGGSKSNRSKSYSYTDVASKIHAAQSSHEKELKACAEAMANYLEDGNTPSRKSDTLSELDKMIAPLSDADKMFILKWALVNMAN